MNPTGRFERFEIEPVPVEGNWPDSATPTLYLRDSSRSVITHNESPDVGFAASLNPYRGCEHGCAYCYARPFHEYLGFSPGLDFETRILVKADAPVLLEEELQKRSWKPKPLALSGVTDPYQPIERRLALTRGCIEVLARFRQPVEIVTKNHMVTRDGDLLANLAADRAAAVTLSVATLDTELSRQLEPRTSTPEGRLLAIRELVARGIPCGVFVAPVIPGLTDHEIPAIVEAARHAGATFGAFCLLRLPLGVKEIFADWLTRHRPASKARVLHRIRETREGRLSDNRFHTRWSGTGEYARHISSLFTVACRKWEVKNGGPDLSSAAFRRPPADQRSLFE